MRVLELDLTMPKMGDYEVFVCRDTGEQFMISGQTLASVPQPAVARVQQPWYDRMKGPRPEGTRRKKD